MRRDAVLRAADEGLHGDRGRDARPRTGLKTVVQIHVNSAGDYYQIDPAIRQRLD
jgi:hypothetical protein